MDDPRKLFVPENADLMRQVEILARDLAYGCYVGEWGPSFAIENGKLYTVGINSGTTEENSYFYDYRVRKWSSQFPVAHMLIVFGYLSLVKANFYRLSSKSFDLLKQPAVPPKVFISYKRAESSAFALLVEARLVLAGADTPFIDKNLKGGDKWHDKLRERIEACEYLVCLVGPSTLSSEYVKKEIHWAYEANRTIIPICHNGQTLATCQREMPLLTEANGYEIKGSPGEHSAADYETAVNFVLNSMGYRTY